MLEDDGDLDMEVGKVMNVVLGTYWSGSWIGEMEKEYMERM